LPAEGGARLVAAGAKAHATAEVQDPLKQRGFNPMWSGPEKAREFALGFATSTRDVLTDLGLAKQ
jgi:tripartite-type tricarboxylate transporter receptor subunit TctC